MEPRFEVGQLVRLVVDRPPVAAGSEGRILGYYAREAVAYLVSFDGVAWEIAQNDLEAAGAKAED